MSKKLEYATLRSRVIAGLIDTIFLSPIFIILIYYFGVGEYKMVQLDEDFYYYSQVAQSKISGRFIDYIAYAFAIIYSVYFVASKRMATPGKMIMKIYVGDIHGKKLTIAHALWRCAASLLTAFTFGLGLLPVIFTKEKTSLHDMICKTRVFKK